MSLDSEGIVLDVPLFHIVFCVEKNYIGCLFSYRI